MENAAVYRQSNEVCRLASIHPNRVKGLFHTDYWTYFVIEEGGRLEIRNSNNHVIRSIDVSMLRKDFETNGISSGKIDEFTYAIQNDIVRIHCVDRPFFFSEFSIMMLEK